MKNRLIIIIGTIILSHLSFSQDSDTLQLTLIKTIEGNISPKSIVQGTKTRFFAQNMMYQHSVTVYDAEGNLIKTISDEVDGSLLDPAFSGKYRGAPVEAAVTFNGRYLWVSNYEMFGKGFHKPGRDNCRIKDTYDKSYLYKINTSTLAIEESAKTGCIPKYVAVTANNKYVLVTNWCSGDLSIINTANGETVQQIFLGKYPRGIAIEPSSKYAWVAVMGDKKIAKVNLETLEIDKWYDVGRGPRHLCLRADTLYISLNKDNKIVKFNTRKGTKIGSVRTGKAPRSMVLSRDGQYLYVVNYKSNTMSKVRASDMSIIESVKTKSHPIGITFDPFTENIWVACYSGAIQIFHDGAIPKQIIQQPKDEAEGPYHIVIGSFKIKSNADRELQRCNELGYNTKIIMKNDFYCLSGRRFDDLMEARNALKKIYRDFPQAWVMKK